MKKEKSLFWRMIYYYVIGSNWLNLPIGIFGIVSLVYYNFVVNFEPVRILFPNFTSFIIVGFGGGIFLAEVIGYLIRKKTNQFSEQQKVDIESNVYATEKVLPNALPLLEFQVKLGEALRIEDQYILPIKELLARSGSKRYVLVNGKVEEMA